MKRHVAALVFLAAAAVARGQSVNLLHSAVGTSVPADASLDLVINNQLSDESITVYDVTASYTATAQFRFISTAFMLPGTTAAGGSGGYVGANFIGTLDGNYGCQLTAGSFTDTGGATYNLGDAGDTTWLSNFNGLPAPVVVPGSFVSTTTQIAERIGNFLVEPPGPVINRVQSRIRVNALSSGIISADIRCGPGATTRIGKQWRITSVPEPGTLALLAGLGLIAGLRRRRWPGRRGSVASRVSAGIATTAIVLVCAAGAAHGQSVSVMAEARGTAMPADASFDMVINAGLSTDAVTVYDIIASYTATPTFRFVQSAFMLPGTPAAGGSGAYREPNYIGALDGNYGCQLEYGSFTDTGVTTYNLGNAGNTTWLSNFDGGPAPVVTPTSFLSTPTQIAERIGNTAHEPEGPVVNRIYARVRVNANSSGVISADIRLGPSQVSNIGKQWRITSIPEPGTLALLAGIGIVAGRRRRHWPCHRASAAGRATAGIATAAVLLICAASAAHGQSVSLLHSAVGTSVPADASFDLVVNGSLSDASITVFDLVASYTATWSFGFYSTAFMVPGTPSAGGSGGYVGPNFVGALDGNYGCQLTAGSFTDAPIPDYNLGNAGNATWLSSFDGFPGTVTPGSFISTPTWIAERVARGSIPPEPPASVVERIYGRIRVNANSSGVISADIRLGRDPVSRIGKQWRITSVPEPPMLVLLAAGGLAAVRRSRRLWAQVGARA